MGVHVRVDVFGLNLRLASLMLATIGKLCDVKMEVSLQTYGDDDHAGIQNWFSIVLQPSG